MRKLAFGVLILVLATAALAGGDAFKDPLDVPATMLQRRMLSMQMNAVTRAGERLIAVGARGLVLISDDGGKQWKQAGVPVSSDLLAVNFPTAKDGWVTGHDGVVLHTRDGGNTWEKQLDGRMTKKLLMAHFQSLVDSGKAEARHYLQDTQINYEGGPEQALLGVWFKDPLHGFVCGSFGTLLATDDGGVTWTSWVENVEIDMSPHYYAIRGTKQGVMMASEKGIVFRLDENKKRFVAMPTGYTGTFFSLLEAGESVLVAGLRGTAYRLKGGGVGKWEPVTTGVTNTITASAAMPDGEVLLATLTGQLLGSRGGGEHFEAAPVARPMSFAGVAAAGPGSVVVVGNRGVRTLPLR